MPPSLDLLFPEPVDAIAATWIRACDEEFLSPNRPGLNL